MVLKTSATHEGIARRDDDGIGVIVPFDFAVDREYWRYVPDDTQLHITRTPPEPGEISTALAQAVGDVEAVRAATETLVPVTGTVVYACTSGSFVAGLKGEARLRACMKQAGADVAVTTSGGLLEALQALNVRSVSVATPYDAELTERLVSFLAAAGVEVVAAEHLGLIKDVHRVTPEKIVQLALQADHDGAESVFISCTGFATFNLIEKIERLLGKPLLTANQVTMWAGLRASGRRLPPLPQALFREPGLVRKGTR
jgi:maleate isomerase